MIAVFYRIKCCCGSSHITARIGIRNAKRETAVVAGSAIIITIFVRRDRTAGKYDDMEDLRTISELIALPVQTPNRNLSTSVLLDFWRT